MVRDACRIQSVGRLVDLEVREKSRRFPLENANDLDRASANLQLGSLARSELEHRPPRPPVRRNHDFCLGAIRSLPASSLAGHVPPIALVPPAGVPCPR